MENTNEIDILLVEDSHLDAEITIRTLKKNNFVNSLHWVKNGQEALDFLFCAGADTRRKGMDPPKLVLLDIKMPKVNGIEVLQKIRADPKLHVVPVIIMTSSSEMPNVQEACRLGVNGYLQKPVDFGAFSEALSRLGTIITKESV